MNAKQKRLIDELATHCDRIDGLTATVRVVADWLEENNDSETTSKLVWHIHNCLQDIRNEIWDTCGEIMRNCMDEAS